MSGQQGGDDKNSMAILWIIAGVFMVAGIIWIAFAEQLKMAFIAIRRGELYLLYWTMRWLPFPETNALLKDTLHVMQLVRPQSLNLPLAEGVSILVGEFLRWPFTLLLGIATYVIYIRNVKLRYKKRYDMERLANQESAEWPQINPVLNTNLVEQDLDEGPWAMAMPPMLFCKRNNLLDVTLDTSGDMFRKGPKFKALLREARAEQIFVNQLGRLWHEPESMPFYRRALFAAFIARGCRDSATAKNLIIQINRSCHGGNLRNLDFTGVDELWKKHYKKREVQDVIQAHAYEFTIFTAIFLFARKDGVFPCSDFLWLKPIDRRFWYVLNNVGRQTPVCEAAGVYAHFLAEKNLGRKLNTPVVQGAVNALRSGLGDIIYLAGDEEKDRLLREAEEAGNN